MENQVVNSAIYELQGYAIVLDQEGKAMTDAKTAKAGDEIRARLSKGELLANVTKVIKE